MLFCRYRISALISLPKFSTNISRFPLKLWSPISKPHRASNSETRQNNLARSMTTIFPHVNPLACSIDNIFLFFFNPLFAIFAIWRKETKKTTKPMIRWIIRIFPRNARRQSKNAACRMEKGINRAETRRERERESFRARALAANWNRRCQRENRRRRKGKRNVRRDINKVVASSFLFSSFHALLFHRGFARFSIEDCKLSASERQQTRDSTTSPGSLPAELIVVASRQRHSSPCFTYLRFSTTRPFRVMSLVKRTSIAKERFNPRYPRTTLEILSIFSHFSESAPILLEFRRVGRNSKLCNTENFA